MDILVIHNSYLQQGGEDTVFRAEVGLLSGQGHRVITHHVSNDAVARMGRAAAAAGAVWNQRSYETVREVIRRSRPQVVHLHNTFPLVSPSVYYAARRERVPVVQTLHNYRLLCPAATLFRDGAVCTECVGRTFPHPAIQHRCYRDSALGSGVIATMVSAHRVARTWTSRVDRYITLSEWSRRLFIDAGLPADKIQVKPNFVSPDPSLTAKAQRKGPRALFVGRLVAEKGIATMLRAWREIGARVPLDIVGDGPRALEVNQAAQEIPGVRWLGERNRQGVYQAMAEATMLVMPSEWWEPFGLSLVEAYAMGLPVIASGGPGLAEIVRDGVTGSLFKAGDAAELGAAVLRLADDEELRDRMAWMARREYERSYTAAANYSQLMEVYRLALGGQSRSSLGDATDGTSPGVRFFPGTDRAAALPAMSKAVAAGQ